jgi:Aspartyl protease
MRSSEHATPCAYSHHVSVRLNEPITFATVDGTTHAPLVNANVNGVRTLLILDTGASDHLLTADLCEAAGVATEPGEPGTDSTGSSVPSWQARQVTVRVGEVDFTFPDVVAIDTPPPFRRMGIGGILSPQRLQPGSPVVLDLSADHVVVFETAHDVDDWLADGYRRWRTVRLPAVDGDGTVLVEAAIDSFAPVVTMLDTGAKATYAAQTAVPGLGEGGVRRSTGRGVGGTESFGVEVPGRVLHIGDAALPVDLLIAGHELGIARCVVGMDLLRGTVLAVGGPPGSPVRWLLP